jgi:N-carbamoylputrescine amidase
MKVTYAAIQCSFSSHLNENVEKVVHFIETAVSKGAQVVLPPELFEGPYFCREEKAKFFEWARPVENHPTLALVQKLARKHRIVIPTSFFEREGQRYFNSLAMIGVEGQIQGVYRKSHIPDGPGYEEKFYFHPGNTGFKVWETPYGRLGVGICWDQWFPECARTMMLMGADALFYPSAIGSEPDNPGLDTKDPWQRAMIGHAVSNVVPVVACNRIGTEGEQVFFGHSFISDHRGEKVSELSRNEEGCVLSTFDLEAIRLDRASFGFFRDRRPELYQGGGLVSL